MAEEYEYSYKIDRSKWRCGHASPTGSYGKGKTEMLNEEGFQCCLGQICEQAQGSKEGLLHSSHPSAAINKKLYSAAPWLYSRRTQWDTGHSKTTTAMLYANDETRLPDHIYAGKEAQETVGIIRTLEDREKALIYIAGRAGVKLEFHGEYDKDLIDLPCEKAAGEC